MAGYCIINTENRIFAQRVEEYGYRCIGTIPSLCVSTPVSRHADVLYLKTDDNVLYISECQKENVSIATENGYTVKTVQLSPEYATECRLNMVVVEDIVLCNPKTCMDIGMFGNKTIIRTNQGYTRCSTVVMEDGFITEDENIYKALTACGKQVLLIKKGYVSLEGYDYGFIGGASVYMKDKKILLFFGDISIHPDYLAIKDFCGRNGVKTDYIKDIKLTDIGGAVFI